MAITYVGAGAAAYVTANPVPAMPAHTTDDLLVLAVGTKPDTAAATVDASWTLLGVAQGGVGTTGIDTGPMRVGIFYKVATSAAEASPTIDIPGNSVTSAQVFCFRKGAGTTWDVAGTGAADTTTGTPHSVAMPVNPGLTVGDMLFAIGVIPTDFTTPTQFSAETVAATGMTTVTMTEIIEWDTSSGQDMGGWVSYGTVASGTATANPTVSATASGTTTNVAGPIYLSRFREVPVSPNKSASDSAAISVAESAVVSDLTVRTTPYVVWSGSTYEEASANGNRAPILSVPAHQANDIILLTMSANPATSTFTTPFGFTQISNTTQNNSRMWVGYSISSGGATDLFLNVTSSNAVAATAVIIRGADVADPFINAVGGVAPATATLTFPGITPVSAASLLVYIGAHRASAAGTVISTSTNPAGGTGGAVVKHVEQSTITNINPAVSATVWGQELSSATAIASATATANITGSNNTETLVFKAVSQGGGTQNVTANDTASISVSESAQVSSTDAVTVTDSSAIAVSESASLSKTIVASDSGGISVVETSSLFKTIESSDSGGIAVGEGVGLFKTIESSDSGSIAVGENTQVALTLNASDTGSLAVVENNQSAKTLTATDSAGVSASETTQSARTFAGTDSAALSVTDTANKFSDLPGQDQGVISVTETANVVIGGVITKTASDSAQIAVTETRSVGVSLSRADSAAIAAVETNSSSRAFTLSDSSGIQVEETTSTIVYLVLSDTGAISVAEFPEMVQDTKTVQVKVYHQGQWKNGIIRVYLNGEWREATVKVRRDGSWV